ncbi:MAG: hypothetical protein ABI741_12260 [Ferruginibacter sp.]
MKSKIIYKIAILVTVLYSCSPRNISTKYYEQNRTTLDSIQQSYTKLFKQKPFIVGFTDKAFENISLEIITDSLTYIYDFKINEKRLSDSLFKYNLNSKAVTELINQMHSIRCTWVNSFDYFVEGEKKSLVFLSIKPVGLSRPFSNKKYYVITYFSQKQYYDKKGRLVNNRKQRQLQKLNGEVFKRINDKVSYTVSSTYR